MLLDEVRDDLGVGLGRELVPLGLETPFQFHVVLDDAVVDHDDRAAAVPVGVSVFLGGGPVGGPARVADAISAVQGVLADRLFQVPQLACRAPHIERAIAHHRQAGGVIAAVLKPLQPFEQHRHHALVPDVADDPGHDL